MSENDLKAEGLSLLAANSGMSDVYMAKNGQGFADKHDAIVMNNKLGFKGKEEGAVKVSRSGNEKAIAALVEAIEQAHQEALEASLAEQDRLREEKKRIKNAKELNRRGLDIGMGESNEALNLALAENEKLKTKIAELEAAAAEEPAAEEPAAGEPAPSKKKK